MSPRTISRSAVGGYIKLLRLPLDAAVGLRTRNGRHGVSGATIKLDRMEAGLRRMPARPWATKSWCATPSAGAWPRTSGSGQPACAPPHGGGPRSQKTGSRKKRRRPSSSAARRRAGLTLARSAPRSGVRRRAAGSPDSSHGAGAQTRRPPRARRRQSRIARSARDFDSSTRRPTRWRKSRRR